MVEHYYIHRGSYNKVGDIRKLSGKPTDEVIKYWKDGCGSFQRSRGRDEESDICLEEEFPDAAEVPLYIVTDTSAGQNINDEYPDALDSDDSMDYIDIYQLYRIKENGIIFDRIIPPYMY